MRYFFLYFILLFSIIFTSCNTKNNCNCSDKLPKNSKGKTIVRLQQQWFANSGFAGEIMAMNETAAKNGLQIEIIPGSDQIDTKSIVKANEAEFGVAGAEQIMKANEKDTNFVIIGVINYKSLACFISKKSKNIIRPQDFVGRKIGTMEGTPVALIYEVLKKKENLNIPKSDEIPTGWVLTGFLRDEYDIYPAFINDEPITLKLKGIDVNIIRPNLSGVNFVGTVYFCNKKFAECYPNIVQSFINSIAEGWELALDDPSKAILELKGYDNNIDKRKELESLIVGADYYLGEDGKVLYAKDSTWNNMASMLESIGYIKSFNITSTVDNKYIAWYHYKVKSK